MLKFCQRCKLNWAQEIKVLETGRFEPKETVRTAHKEPLSRGFLSRQRQQLPKPVPDLLPPTMQSLSWKESCRKTGVTECSQFDNNALRNSLVKITDWKWVYQTLTNFDRNQNVLSWSFSSLFSREFSLVTTCSHSQLVSARPGTRTNVELSFRLNDFSSIRI